MSYTMNHIPFLCDIESAIMIAYNHCEHSRTKHINIWQNFLRDHAIKGDIVISHVGTNDQLADIFTKSLDEK
jgi:tetrahydromethanopterin S-methyltransferase subunit H